MVGELRDADVLMSEVVAGAARLGLDPAARGALDAALEARRDRCGPRSARRLAGRAATGFLFDLGAFIEGRGWLVASDYSQSARLAAPDRRGGARASSPRRHRKAMKLGRKVRELDAAGLHELRKELKKLRYTVDMLAPLYGGGRMRDLSPGAQGAAGQLRQHERRGHGRRGADRAGRAGGDRPGGAAAAPAGPSARWR